MTKLLKSHRQAITDHLLAATFRERELRLKQQEHALGVKLLRAYYGDDLHRMAELPDGWLPMTTTLQARIGDDGRTYRLSLTDPIRVPANHSYMMTVPLRFGLRGTLPAHFDQVQALKEERRQLELEVRGTLAAFTTVERLAEDWPEGYAHFPHQDLAPAALPALRIEDLNARLAAAREAA